MNSFPAFPAIFYVNFTRSHTKTEVCPWFPSKYMASIIQNVLKVFIKFTRIVLDFTLF